MCIRDSTHTHTRTHTYTHTRTHTHIRTHSRIRTHIYTRTHTRARARTHAQTSVAYWNFAQHVRTAASVRLFSPSCRLLWFWNSPRQLSISAWELVPGGQFLVKPKYRLAHKTTQPSLLFSVGQCACSQEAGRGQAWCLTGVTAGGGLRKRAASGVFIVSLAGELFCIFGLEIGTMGFPAGGRCLSLIHI